MNDETGNTGDTKSDRVLLGTKADGTPFYFTRRMVTLLDSVPSLWIDEQVSLQLRVTNPVEPSPFSLDPTAFRAWVLQRLAPEDPPPERTGRAWMKSLQRAKRLASHRYPSVQVGYLKREGGPHPIHMSEVNLHTPAEFESAWAHLRAKPEWVPFDAEAFTTAERFQVWTRAKLDEHKRAIRVQIEIGKLKESGQPFSVTSDMLLAVRDDHPLAWNLILFEDAIDPVKPGLFETVEGFEDWLMDAIDAVRAVRAAPPTAVAGDMNDTRC